MLFFFGKNTLQIVLISTYWNVNMSSCSLGFNVAVVLISTYWNVNQRGKPQRGRPQRVLISTYWNVNTNWEIKPKSVITGFNLNLLECKLFCHYENPT